MTEATMASSDARMVALADLVNSQLRHTKASLARDREMAGWAILSVTPHHMVESVAQEVERRTDLFRNWYEQSMSTPVQPWDPMVAAANSVYADITSGRWPT